MFFNISNHPSARWSDSHRAAAEKLGGEIFDIQFPAVSPLAEGLEILELANDVANYVTSLASSESGSFTVAMVQGEFTLTMALVCLLQERGIRCVAACSTRRVVENGDGSKTVHYNFVQFRDYPS